MKVNDIDIAQYGVTLLSYSPTTSGVILNTFDTKDDTLYFGKEIKRKPLEFTLFFEASNRETTLINISKVTTLLSGKSTIKFYDTDTLLYDCIYVDSKHNKINASCYEVTFTMQAVQRGALVVENANVVNLYGKGFARPLTDFDSFQATQLTNCYVKVVCDGSLKDIYFKELATIKLVANKNYTIVTEILSNTNTTSYGLNISTSTGTLCPYINNITLGQNKQTGLFKHLVTTENPIDANARMARVYTDAGCNGEIIFRQMLLEGDWTNKDLPATYWENTLLTTNNNGTRECSCILEVTPTTATSVTVNDIVLNNLIPNKTIIIDGYKKTVTQDGVNKFMDVSLFDFPKLKPGINRFNISDITTKATLKYYPTYI